MGRSPGLVSSRTLPPPQPPSGLHMLTRSLGIIQGPGSPPSHAGSSSVPPWKRARLLLWPAAMSSLFSVACCGAGWQPGGAPLPPDGGLRLPPACPKNGARPPALAALLLVIRGAVRREVQPLLLFSTLPGNPQNPTECGSSRLLTKSVSSSVTLLFS